MRTEAGGRYAGRWLLRAGSCLFVAAAFLAGCGVAPQTRPAAPELPADLDPPPAPAWKPIGYSVQGRPLLVAQSGSGPLRVYLVGGMHGDEIEGRSALEPIRSQPDAAVTLRIIRDLNPDGSAAYRRANARGYDLNRNWPASNFKPGATGGPAPLSEPETRALAADLRAFKPDVVVVLHSIATGPMVNYDGPAGALASAFADAARSVSPAWYVEPDMGYETSGSIGTYLGIDQKIPILTIEFRRGQGEAAAAAALRKGLAATVRVASAPSQSGTSGNR
jgi:protein MpaA